MPSGLPPHVAALLDPSLHGEGVQQVDLIQTHISWVLLAGPLVYKLKKPVDFGFLDFRTLGQRRVHCEREVALNRRLCPELYLGTVPIRQVDGGRHALGDGPGEIVDYAVQMRRLPQEGLLDRLLAAGTATEEQIRAIGRRLAEFHATAETGPEIATLAGPAAVRANWEQNEEQIAPYLGRTIAPAAAADLRAFFRACWPELEPILERRAAAGRVRDGHGDARAENICLVEGVPWIFDCIEFNDHFRCGDVANEVAFLAMDLDWWDRPDLPRAYVDAYIEASGDAGILDVLRYFRCSRAVVRGKVESFRLDQTGFSDEQRAAASGRAQRYFALAVRYARDAAQPILLIVMGLSGTGKTTLAEALAAHLGWPALSTDAVRREVLSRNAPDLYHSEQVRRVYAEQRARAERHLVAGDSVILDGTFLDPAERRAARDLAWQQAARAVVVECSAPAHTIRERLDARQATGRSDSDADWAIHLAQRDRRADAGESGPDNTPDLRVDTLAPLNAQIASVTEYLARSNVR